MLQGRPQVTDTLQFDAQPWDSGESTRTRDFDYFQARLRGDYEWEIDCLNMQRQR